MKTSHIATQGENNILRRLLWLYHGHKDLYGDGGTMQCAECRLDYKNDSIEIIKNYFNDMELKRMVDFSVALEKKEDDDEKNKEN